ncbi:tyrosine-type recombinase/integrase [Komagataeibacter swingsii]|uniref:Tyr recombinase domain-containing protein n=1 Tax=Komagataeibacter swingsii TaxID=215220 RepID=A0A2V4RMP9_9PROT|nr:hypothetical protein CFR76_12975 [Komagataeibacter swingsii]
MGCLSCARSPGLHRPSNHEVGAVAVNRFRPSSLGAWLNRSSCPYMGTVLPDDPGSVAFVFAGVLGGPSGPRTGRRKPIHKIRTAFSRRVAKAGLDDVTPHTLRHICATWMVMAGVPLQMVAKFFGKRCRDGRARPYGHHGPDWLAKATDALSVSSGPRGPDNTEMRNNKVQENHGAAGQD